MTLAFRPKIFTSVLAGVSLLGLLVTGCDYNPSDEAAVTVNGHVTTMAEFRSLIDGFEAGKGCTELLGTNPAIVFGANNSSSGMVLFLSNVIVQDVAYSQALENAKLTVTPEQTKSGEAVIAGKCPNGEDQKLSASARGLLVGFLAKAKALSDGKAQPEVVKVTAVLDVSVNTRIGRWNAATVAVVPPNGPVRIRTTSTTTAAPQG